MLLNALVSYAQELQARGEIPKEGWSAVKCQYALHINDDGALTDIISLGVEEIVKKKTVIKYPTFSVPYRSKHQNGPTPFLLADNPKYLLGLADEHGPDQKALQCFGSSKKLHDTVLENVSTVKATALRRFFERWTPERWGEYTCVIDKMEELLGASNLVFLFDDGTFAHEDPAIAAAWDSYYQNVVLCPEGAVRGTCLITGAQNVPIAKVHPAITGVPGAKGTGVSLVSFGTNYNVCAYNYYGESQGYVAPTSMLAAAQYGNALKYLLKSPAHCKMMGETYMVFWASGIKSEELSKAFSMGLLGRQEFAFAQPEDELLYRTVMDMLAARPAADEKSSMMEALEADFHVAWFRCHAARLALVEYQHATFGEIMVRLRNHLDRATIISSFKDKDVFRPSVYDLVNALDRSDKDTGITAPDLKDKLLNAILTGAMYPHELLSLVLRRIRVDRSVSQSRMAIIKMYLLRNSKSQTNKEAATVALNPDSTNQAYLLGQLFWHFEAMQKAAIGKVNRSVKDQYFSAAIFRPASVFPSLISKAGLHIGKLKRKQSTAGLGIYYEKIIEDITGKMNAEPFPNLFTPEESGLFALGYYHAKQASFKRKTVDGTDNGTEAE